MVLNSTVFNHLCTHFRSQTASAVLPVEACGAQTFLGTVGDTIQKQWAGAALVSLKWVLTRWHQNLGSIHLGVVCLTQLGTDPPDPTNGTSRFGLHGVERKKYLIYCCDLSYSDQVQGWPAHTH